MKSILKQLAVLAVQPLAVVTKLFGKPIQRLWAHANLGCSIEWPVDTSVVVLGSVEVQGTGRIRIGRGVYFYPGVYLETQLDGEIVIGDNVVISSGAHLVAFDRIEIGCGTMIGEYTSVRDANHQRSPHVPQREAGYLASPVHIGPEVWIGRGAAILRGVTIGEAATIGANAVVTHNVPAGELHAGVPAHRIDTALNRAHEDSQHAAVGHTT